MNHPWDHAYKAQAERRVHPGAGSVAASFAGVGEPCPPQAYPPLYRYQPQQRQALPLPHNRTAVFVIGLLSILCIGFGFVLGPLALVLASKDVQAIREGRASKDGLLTAGYVMATISTTLWALIAGFVMLGLFIAA